MPQHYDVASLGNAIVDIIASVDDRFLLTHRIAKGGMTLIDEFRARELHKALADNQQSLSHLHEVAGGSCANTMAGLASLGGSGVYVGKVHDDRLGGVFTDSMTSLGVDFTTAPGKASRMNESSLEQACENPWATVRMAQLCSVTSQLPSGCSVASAR